MLKSLIAKVFSAAGQHSAEDMASETSRQIQQRGSDSVAELQQTPFLTGYVSEKTIKTKALLDRVSAFGRSGSRDIQRAKAILESIKDDFAETEDLLIIEAERLLDGIVEDGVIDDEESEALSKLAGLFENPVSDSPVTAIAGKRFVLTGEFETEGNKDTVKQMIIAEGGQVTSGVSGKTDYVVVGRNGSPRWGYGSFGNKIRDALKFRFSGKGKAEIVSEAAFLDHVGTNGPNAMKVLTEVCNRFRKQWEEPQVASKGFSGLTAGQQAAFDVVKAGRNLWLTGLGGTGKSYVLNQIIEWARNSGKNVIVSAPTGIAALNVGGSTVHRVLGITPEMTLGLKFSPYVPDDSPLIACDLMVVDEISMCRMDLFDYLSSALRIAASRREDKKISQLVVVGDFCQLPPVFSKGEKAILDQKYGRDVGGGFPFSGFFWEEWHFERIELFEAIRQRDASFVAALNAVRVGDTRGLRWIEEHSAKEPVESAITLCGRNADASKINDAKLGSLQGEPTVYEGRVEGEVEPSDMATEIHLALKPGARVMALVNDSEKTFMNGSLGTVLFCENAGAIVDFDGLGPSFVGFHRWDVTRPYLKEGKTKLEVIGTFTQLPLKLAWAITIHKAQGQTFEAVTLYPECWDSGQLYTALSRVTEVSRLFIAYEMLESFLVVSQDVLRFVERAD